MSIGALRFVPIVGTTGTEFESKNEYNFTLDYFESDFCIKNESRNLIRKRIVPKSMLFCTNSKVVENGDVCVVVFMSKLLIGQFFSINETDFALIDDESTICISHASAVILGVVIGVHLDVV